ncbi:MAG TPA: carboxyl transferase [Candidatus Dorea intestinavium]|nr:carboxyl transferase [Candidatus Dorea intestinavium]
MGSMAQSRIQTLLDEGSFVEIGKLVTARNTDFNLNETQTPGDGVITGYGTIDGNLVYIYGQDNSVLNGTIGEMHARKISKLYDMAMTVGAPIVALLNSGGMRLQEGTDALEAFATIYQKQSLASGIIPQISAIFGTSGGGLAVAAGLSDFVFIEKEKGKLFLNSPNAIEGNTIAKFDTSDAKFQSETSGIVDDCEEELKILTNIRTLIGMLPLNNSEEMAIDKESDDLNRLLVNPVGAKEDAAILVAQLADNNQFFECKKHYAKEMVTGFIKLNGMTVGVAANRSKIYDENANEVEKFEETLTVNGAKKAADFVQFCDAFEIPVLTLTNVKGFEASKEAEASLARESAKLTKAFANATVPKINVIIGKAFGSAFTIMNSKSLGADQVFAWPESQIGMMDAAMAAKIMYPQAKGEELAKAKADYDALQNNSESAARRGYVDAIIAPEETRKYLIGAFEMLFTKRIDTPYKKHDAK